MIFGSMVLANSCLQFWNGRKTKSWSRANGDLWLSYHICCFFSIVVRVPAPVCKFAYSRLVIAWVAAIICRPGSTRCLHWCLHLLCAVTADLISGELSTLYGNKMLKIRLGCSCSGLHQDRTSPRGFLRHFSKVCGGADSIGSESKRSLMLIIRPLVYYPRRARSALGVDTVLTLDVCLYVCMFVC